MADVAERNDPGEDWLVRVRGRDKRHRVATDWKTENMARSLTRMPQLRDVPRYLVVGFCQLNVLSTEVRSEIKRYGLYDKNSNPWWFIYQSSARRTSL